MASDPAVDEMFGLLSDETRVGILRAIAVAEHELDEAGGGPATLAFSEIYDRIDVDNTSKLSYHLGELAGTYLRKDGDEYTFTHAGERIVRFVLSGNYGRPSAFGPEPVAGTCLFCGVEALEASLAHRFFEVECASCERQVAGQPVTPAQTEARDGEDLLDSVRRKSAQVYREIRGGICPGCSGVLAADVLDMREGPLPEADPFLVRSECRQCLREYNSPLTYSVAYHPASVAFHWDRGVDVTSKGVWEFHEHVYEGRWTSKRVASDPETYEITLRLDADALRFRLDGSGTVIRTERVRRERGG